MPLTVKRPHEDRLKTLAETNKNDPFAKIVGECQTRYQEFITKFIQSFAAKDFDIMASVLDEYRWYAKAGEKNHVKLSDRTKYYSSILEEVPVLLVKDKVESLVTSLGLDKHKLILGGAECVIRIAANPDGTYFHEKKRIDFCLAIDASSDEIWIPLVGLEVKKYCDKTMFGTILETYKSLQIFRPRTYYGFLVEDEARGSAVVLNSPIYQQEFILSGKSRNKPSLNPVSAACLKHFTEELLNAVEDALDVLAKATSKQGEEEKADISE